MDQTIFPAAGITSGGRIPSLDGLRAISILLVIGGHELLVRGFGETRWIPALLGVKIFFVISGFLITDLLLREDAASGISLKKFYARRTLRIFPLAYTYLLVVFLFRLAGSDRTNGLGWALVYLICYFQSHAGWLVGHFWSLSVEEQFYLAWPPLLKMMRQETAKWIALALMVAIPLGRAMWWLVFPNRKDIFRLDMVTSVDAIVLGCVMALWRSTTQRIGERLGGTGAAIILALTWAVFAVNPESWQRGVLRTAFRGGQDALVHLLVALAIAGSVYGARGWWQEFLDGRIMVWIGALSYSLYVWQQMFLPLDATWFPLGLILTFVVAWVAHLLVERPALRLKSRFEPKRVEAVTA